MIQLEKFSRRGFWVRSAGVGAGILALPHVTSCRVGDTGKQNFELDAQRDVLLERVEKIHADGHWNGRPSVFFWKGRYYILFRAGSEHSSGDGRIRMLKSGTDQPTKWHLSDVVDTEVDDAEVHVLVTPERLFAYVVRADATTERGDPIDSVVTISDDGVTWSRPQTIYDPGFSWWKPVSHSGVHYVAADVMVGQRRVDLLRSTDGLRWEPVSTILPGKFTETALTFLPDDRLLAFTRQGRLSMARPPYTEWEAWECHHMGGPAAALVGDTVLVSGRSSTEVHPDDQPGSSRTALYVLDIGNKVQPLRWVMNMPSFWGKDVSYPDFHVLDGRRALMCWYDGQGYEPNVAKQADLLLATLRLV